MTSLALGLASVAWAQSPPADKGTNQPALRVGHEAASLWQLRLRQTGRVGSALIRLRDIADPIGAEHASWWQRVGGTVVAMMPIGEDDIVIDASRLGEAVGKDLGLPPIRFSGAEQVRVERLADAPSDPTGVATSLEPAANGVGVVPASATSDSQAAGPVSRSGGGASPVAGRPMPADAASPRVAAAAAATPSERSSDHDLPPLSESDSLRLARLIHFAIDRHDLSLRAAYDIEVDPQQPALRSLAGAVRVDSIEFLTPVVEGAVQAVVHAVKLSQPLQATITLQCTARPLVVMARESFRQGHILSRGDVTLQPAPKGTEISEVVTEIDDVVGMQVRSSLAKDRPLTNGSLRRPIVVQRGDLLEVQVVGGGVTVSTNARSLARGAVGDLITVETLEPRKKVMARIARSGVVEIVTRPPRVR